MMAHSIKVSCQKTNLRAIRDFLWEVLRRYALPEAELNLVVVAIDEVCANLMVHSHQCNPSDCIEVFVHDHETDFICEIYDAGEGFNITSYQAPSLDALIREKKAGGMGLMLVKKIMDSIDFDQLSGRNVYRFRKTLSVNNQAI